MGQVHDLIISAGLEAAKENALTKHERLCVETAASVMFDDSQGLNILHSGFALTALPHRQTDELKWVRSGGQNDEIILRIESGFQRNETPIGIPYGSVARLILIYLSTEAVSNGSRTIELGSTMADFLRRVGLSWGGKSSAAVREQARRIAACRLTFYSNTQQNPIMNGNFVRSAIICDKGQEDQPRLWNDTVELDEAFYKSLTEHPLPLREAAVRQLCGKSMALDLYVFLAYRLHVLERPTKVSWAALFKQFGGGYTQKKTFVQAIKEPLGLALAAYPEARVDLDESGLTLHPSPSPVPKLKFPKFRKLS